MSIDGRLRSKFTLNHVLESNATFRPEVDKINGPPQA